MTEDINSSVDEKLKEHYKVLEILDKKGVVPDKDFVDESIVTLPDSGQNIFEDFSKMLEEFNKDENIFKLSTIRKNDIYPDTLLGALARVPYYPKKMIGDVVNPDYVKPRYTFVVDFRNIYHVNLSAVDGKKLELFTDIASSFMQYSAMLDMQRARVGDMDGNGTGATSSTSKRGLMNLFKKK